jgi:hypothetical protein
MKTFRFAVMLATLVAGASVAVYAADDDFDKALAKLRASIPFKPYEERFANGKVRERGRARCLGVVCGNLWTEYDGLLEGWYESGVKECEIPHKNGDRDGVALNWFPNGKKKYIVTWKNGKRDGDFTMFYDSEAVSATGRFSDEVLKEADFFDRDGKRVTREQWLAIPSNRQFWR